MKKVRYVPCGDLSYGELTIGKVYDVIHYSKYTIRIIDDNNAWNVFFISSITPTGSIDEFIDVTPEFRNELIDDILK